MKARAPWTGSLPKDLIVIQREKNVQVPLNAAEDVFIKVSNMANCIFSVIRASKELYVATLVEKEISNAIDKTENEVEHE